MAKRIGYSLPIANTIAVRFDNHRYSKPNRSLRRQEERTTLAVEYSVANNLPLVINAVRRVQLPVGLRP